MPQRAVKESRIIKEAKAQRLGLFAVLAQTWLKPESIPHLTKAVAPMQACALHLRDRTPNSSASRF